MKMIKILILAGLAITYMVLSSGAAVANEGVCTDTTYLSSGWVSKGYEGSLVDARRAVEESFRDNQIKIVKKDDLIAAGLTRIKGQSQNMTYWVDISSIADPLTKVSVRSGPEDISAAKKLQCDIESKM